MQFWLIPTFTLLGTAVALADKGGIPHHAAPGPIAGAGLPLLAVAGGYWLFKRYRNRKKV